MTTEETKILMIVLVFAFVAIIAVLVAWIGSMGTERKALYELINELLDQIDQIDEATADSLTEEEPLLAGSAIFISGPMSNMPDFNAPAFNAAEKHLKSIGHKSIYNPAKLPEGCEYRDYVDTCFVALQDCSEIYMLHGWQQSKGARLEHQYAVNVGMRIRYEDLFGTVSPSEDYLRRFGGAL